MDKKKLSEADIRSKFIPQAGWDLHDQIREEVALTSGKIIVITYSNSDRPLYRT